MRSFNKFGWNNFFQNYLNNFPDKNLKIGRVGSIAGFKYLLLTQKGEIEAELSGKLLYAALNEDLPKVGDWVFYMDYVTMGYIVDVFPRMNEVYRKVAGKRNERQVLAANVDYALIVQGLDREFNLMRLDRYLVQMVNCNIKPVVVLNKADLIDNPDQYRDEIDKLNRKCPVYFCSTYNGSGLESLIKIFESGKTSAFYTASSNF